MTDEIVSKWSLPLESSSDVSMSQVGVELQSVGGGLLGEALAKVILEDVHSLLQSSTLGLTGSDKTSSKQVTLGCGIPLERGAFGRGFHGDDGRRGMPAWVW